MEHQVKQNNRMIKFKDGTIAHWLTLAKGSTIRKKYNPNWLSETQLYKTGLFEYIDWFMMCYIKHLKPNLKRNYEVLPYSKIEEMGAKMYKWLKSEV